MSCQIKAHLIVCLHCTILDSSTVNFVQYCSSINILVMYRKRSSEETDADTSSTSDDFDKPPRPGKKRLSVSLIIYCGCQSIFDMERHCVLALSKITWSTAYTCTCTCNCRWKYYLEVTITILI